MNKADLSFDRDHIWHPYTSMADPLRVYPVRSASGVRLTLADGRELIDGMSSWWSAIHGYNHPDLNRAITDQLKDMAHVMFGGITHRPAVQLARHLIRLTPGPLRKVFFADSGSVAVEVAMKMALQYWHATGAPERRRFLTVRSGYHGDTFNAMSVCDPVAGMHHLFHGVLPANYFADAPRCRFDQEWDEADMHSFQDLIATHHAELAAVILEPIVQGAGGMRFYSPEFLRRVRQLCDRFDVLLILDEIATGFGRTGTMFACEHAGVSPDIMCLGKALTGGCMSLAATLTTERVSAGIATDHGVLMHGPTFMANPLACAAAAASIELLCSGPWQQRVRRIERGLRAGLAPCRRSSHVAEVRVLGAIGVVELTKLVDLAVAQQHFVERGVWLRPFGRLVYTMPPFIIDDDDLGSLTRAMSEVVADESLLRSRPGGERDAVQ